MRTVLWVGTTKLLLLYCTNTLNVFLWSMLSFKQYKNQAKCSSLDLSMSTFTALCPSLLSCSPSDLLLTADCVSVDSSCFLCPGYTCTSVPLISPQPLFQLPTASMPTISMPTCSHFIPIAWFALTRSTVRPCQICLETAFLVFNCVKL